YPLALVLTFGTALLQWGGFTRLAYFVWFRTWAVAGVVLGAILLHHLLRLALHRWVLAARASEEALSFYRSTTRLLDYVGVVAVLLITLRLTGLGAPLRQILGFSFATVADKPLTALV